MRGSVPISGIAEESKHGTNTSKAPKRTGSAASSPSYCMLFIFLEQGWHTWCVFVCVVGWVWHLENEKRNRAGGSFPSPLSHSTRHTHHTDHAGDVDGLAE